MIVHMLLGKARDDLDSTEKAELEKAIAELGNVRGVIAFSSGTNFGERSKGYTHGAVMHFAGRDSLSAYASDDYHRQLIQVFERLMPERLVLDYETGSNGMSV